MTTAPQPCNASNTKGGQLAGNGKVGAESAVTDCHGTRGVVGSTCSAACVYMGPLVCPAQQHESAGDTVHGRRVQSATVGEERQETPAWGWGQGAEGRAAGCCMEDRLCQPVV